MSFYTAGYFINLVLLGHLLWWLVSTNSWTPGKKVMTAVVGIQTWNYLWACLNLTLLSNVSLDYVTSFGYQIPTVITLIYVHTVMRNGGDGGRHS